MGKVELDFGKYEGYDIDNVPPDYLLWLWEQDWLELRKPELYDYIKRNLRSIMIDAGQKPEEVYRGK